MKFLKIALLTLALSIVFMSCTTFKASGLNMTAEPQNYSVVGNFETSVWVSEFLGSPAGVNLFNVTANATDSAVRDAIQREIKAKGGTAAVNVTITNEASFPNILLTGVTFGLYAPGTLIITGTIVK